jgi:hypothetical protein
MQRVLLVLESCEKIHPRNWRADLLGIRDYEVLSDRRRSRRKDRKDRGKLWQYKPVDNWNPKTKNYTSEKPKWGQDTESQAMGCRGKHCGKQCSHNQNNKANAPMVQPSHGPIIPATTHWRQWLSCPSGLFPIANRSSVLRNGLTGLWLSNPLQTTCFSWSSS